MVSSDYVGTTYPLDKPDDELVTVVVMDFFLNDVGAYSPSHDYASVLEADNSSPPSQLGEQARPLHSTRLQCIQTVRRSQSAAERHLGNLRAEVLVTCMIRDDESIRVV